MACRLEWTAAHHSEGRPGSSPVPADTESQVLHLQCAQDAVKDSTNGVQRTQL